MIRGYASKPDRRWLPGDASDQGHRAPAGASAPAFGAATPLAAVSVRTGHRRRRPCRPRRIERDRAARAAVSQSRHFRDIDAGNSRSGAGSPGSRGGQGSHRRETERGIHHPCRSEGRREGQRRHRDPRSLGGRPEPLQRAPARQGADRRQRHRAAADARRRWPASRRRLCAAVVGRARRARGDRDRRARRLADRHAGGHRETAGGGDARLRLAGQFDRPLDAGGAPQGARNPDPGAAGAVRLSERQSRPEHADRGRIGGRKHRASQVDAVAHHQLHRHHELHGRALRRRLQRHGAGHGRTRQPGPALSRRRHHGAHGRPRPRAQGPACPSPPATPSSTASATEAPF